MVLNGHEHNYERFAPQDPNGQPDPGRGIRQFVVGTGGAPLYGFGAVEPTSEARDADTYGVLKLTLGSGEYGWRFLPPRTATFGTPAAAPAIERRRRHRPGDLEDLELRRLRRHSVGAYPPIRSEIHG